jgi:hypothetical protein
MQRMPAVNGMGPSGYSANAGTDLLTQWRGRKSPTMTMLMRAISRGPLRLFTTLIPTLRLMCGVRMTIIAMVPTRMTAFANPGFMVRKDTDLLAAWGPGRRLRNGRI